MYHLLKSNIFLVFVVFYLSSCSGFDFNNHTKKDIKIVQNLEQTPYTGCSRSDARATALKRLWKIYGKDDVKTPFQVRSERNLWVVNGIRLKAPSKIIYVIIPKNLNKCIIKDIFQKRNFYYVSTGIGKPLKKAGEYKCPSHIVSKETCKKLLEYQKR